MSVLLILCGVILAIAVYVALCFATIENDDDRSWRNRAHREHVINTIVRIVHIKGEWNSEAKAWVATSDDIPGLMAQAPTIDILNSTIKTMIAEVSRDVPIAVFFHWEPQPSPSSLETCPISSRAVNGKGTLE